MDSSTEWDDLVAQEAVDELVDTVVQGGREQHPLTAGRGGRQDPRDAGQEAEVGHVVGLVDDGDLHRVQAQRALAHQILEAARAGHDDVDAGAQRGDLAGLRDAAEDRGDSQPAGRRQRFDGGGDLGGQFPGGGQHQAGRLLGPAAAAVEAADQGQGECQRLAAAGLAAAEHVAAGQGVGQGFGLDGKGVVDAACREGGDEWFAHAEVREGRCIHVWEAL